jgi:hypothetical protein
VVAISQPFSVPCHATLERTVSTSRGGEHSATTYRLLAIDANTG